MQNCSFSMISTENQGLVIQGGDGDEAAGEAQPRLPLVSFRSSSSGAAGPAGGQSCRLDRSVPPQSQPQARSLQKARNTLLTSDLCLPPSFSINIGHDPDNLALHFNPRFNYGGDHNTIIFNALSGGCWGDEHREGIFPFAQGEEAKVGGG